MKRRLLKDLSFLTVALVAAGSVARLTVGAPALRAALVSSIVGYVLAAAILVRFPAAASLFAGVAGVILAAAWVAVPSATWHGVPTPTTVRAIDHALRAVGGIHHLPVVASPGVVFVCGLISGVAAIAIRVIPGSFHLFPALALVTGSVVAIPSTGAAWLTVGFVGAAVLGYLAQSEATVGNLLGSSAVIASAACAVVVSAVMAPSAHAVSGGGRAAQGVPPTALSLVSDLERIQEQDPNTVMFTALTPVPTYWQIASLSVFKGNEWVADEATSEAMDGRGAPQVLQAPLAGPTFQVEVTVANLSSRLLPVPPSAVHTSNALSTSAGFVSLTPSTPSERYSVLASVPSAAPSSGPEQLGASGSTAPSASSSTYTSLPSISPEIRQLARSVTSSASTALQKAEALTNWFRSGLFHYSLRSSSSLLAFLTKSRTGSCEQFAGAFAVLARSLGLPSRVVVGFTTGLRDTAGLTVVRGVDAHAWPEVLVAGNWISFEPTPELPSGELAPPGVIGPTGLGNPNPIGPPKLPAAIPRITVPATQPATNAPRAGRGISLWWWLLPTLAVFLLLTLGAFLVVLRRHRRRTPEETVFQAWRRVDAALDRTEFRRPRSRTPSEHARFIGFSTRGDDDWRSLLDDIQKVAIRLERSVYAAEPVGPSGADEAREVSLRISKTLRHTVHVH
jgi:hypothetical protein